MDRRTYMEFLGNIKVIPRLPEELKGLIKLAYNFYYSWHSEVRDLFTEIDRQLWFKVKHNPVKFLQEVQQKKIDEKAEDESFLNRLKKVLAKYDSYINEKNTWFSQHYPDYVDKKIAYFTAEFGFHESLPIYAGGLGVLAGDHLKSASDLGFPIVGISLFYRETYFTQQIDAYGNQVAIYNRLNPQELPIRLVKKSDGSPLLIKVPLANRVITIQAWEVKIGRVTAYLLDSDVETNSPTDREITARLYGGDQETRISQEIVLGMGGVLLLQALDIHPDVWHMNEGHSVFLALQRIKDLHTQYGLDFFTALEAVTANTIFTTHTPVPAGNDAFPLAIKDKYFKRYWESVGIKRHEFMELGSQEQPEGYDIFNLTILALNLSRHRNAVSQLHGEVSRRLWKTLWPDLSGNEVPIVYITNGVHTETWISRYTKKLFDSYLKNNWIHHQDQSEFWKKIDEIDAEALWNTKLEQKKKLFNHILERLEKQFKRNHLGSLQLLRVKQLVKPDVLTIGFARRFATYKRGTLIFRDKERLRRLLNDPDHPVQIIFAGKAHPKDGGGQNLIKQIYQISLEPDFKGKILFVENYDMDLARDLVSGVDVWLNNPRRTQEASGTSGQKAAMNGVLNFSVLDGWWCEGFNGKNGWAFGDNGDIESLDDLDSWDSEELYDILENDIIPLYYQRNEQGLPLQWIEKMKEAIKSILPQFNTDRMIKEYLVKLYLPAIDLGKKYQENDFQVAKNLAKWKEKIEKHWSEVDILIPNGSHFSPEPINLTFGEPYEIEAVVKLAQLDPSDVKVQIFLEKNNDNYSPEKIVEIFDLKAAKTLDNGDYVYSAKIQPLDSGNYKYTLRVLPYHPDLANPMELGLAKWCQPQNHHQ